MFCVTNSYSSQNSNNAEEQLLDNKKYHSNENTNQQCDENKLPFELNPKYKNRCNFTDAEDNNSTCDEPHTEKHQENRTQQYDENELPFELNPKYKDNGNEEYNNNNLMHNIFSKSIYIPSTYKTQISNINERYSTSSIDLSQDANSARFASVENAEQSLQLDTSNEYSEHDSEKQFSFKNANILPANNDNLLDHKNIKECLDLNCILLEEKPKKPMAKFLSELDSKLASTSKLLYNLNNALVSEQYSELLQKSINSIKTTSDLLKEFKEYLIEEEYFLESIDDNKYYT